MPYGNRKGPDGLGPRTGRGLGLCSGSDTPGYLKNRGRRHFNQHGNGRGLGRHHYHNSYNIVDEKTLLEEEIKALEEDLELAKKRLEIIKGEND